MATPKYDHDILLRVLNPATGELLADLRMAQEIQVSFVESGMGALSFSYPKYAPEIKLLQAQHVELTAMIWVPSNGVNGGFWHEPPGARFVLMTGQDDSTDDMGLVRFTASHVAIILDKQKVRKGRNDDALNAAEEAAKKSYEQLKGTHSGASSSLSSQVSTVKGLLKTKKQILVMDKFPSTIVVKKKKQAVPAGTFLWHGGRDRLYVRKSGKWNHVKPTNETKGALNGLNTKWNAFKVTKSAMDKAKATYDMRKKAAVAATKNGQRPMFNSSPGWVMRRHWDETISYGGNRLSGFSRSFNGTYASGANSAGKLYRKWPKRMDYELSIGQSLLKILEDLTEQGMVQWRFRGRTLDMFIPGDMSRDVSRYVSLRLGQDLVEAPDSWSMGDFANVLMVRGNSNLSFAMSNTGADKRSPWGDLERTVQVDADKTAAAKTKALKEAKDSLKVWKVQSTRSIVLRPEGPRPMYDYLPGDYVLTYGSDGSMVKRKVTQVVLTKRGDGDGGYTVSGVITFGDIFQSNPVQFTKSLGKTVGGDSNAIPGGKVSVLPDPDTPVDLSMMPPPVELAASAIAKVNQFTGDSNVVLMLSWMPVGNEDFDDEDPGNIPDDDVDFVDEESIPADY